MNNCGGHILQNLGIRIMNKIVLIWAVVFMATAQLFAQQQHFGCDVSVMEGAIIKQRMMDTRNQFTKQEIQNLMTNRATTYLPVTIHNVSNTSGDGATDEELIYAFLCGLNNIYAAQDVQFFLNEPIRNLVSNFIDANSRSLQSSLIMLQQKSPNTINIYVGRSTNFPGGTATTSFYDPNRDFVFLQQPMVSAAAKTEAHEIGHFLSLNHTFYGWEGVDAEATYGGGNAPTYVTGDLVERVTRGAGANCSTAGDGFCDTEADYHSTDASAIPTCSFTPTVKDPTGATLNPDETNMMSYYMDNCVDNFSTEQQAAIAMNIASRTWATNTPPTTQTVTGVPTAVAPVNNATADISNSTVRIDWDDIAGATWYYLEVYGTNIPGVWLPNTSDIKFKGLVTTGNSHYDLATSGLTVGQRYAWRVKAMNPLSTCANKSTYFKFEATTAVTSIKDLSLDQQMTLKVIEQPVTKSDIALSIHTAEDVVASIALYSMDGRAVINLSKQMIAKGTNTLQLPASNLANGLYMAVLSTEKGNLQQKVILQR